MRIARYSVRGVLQGYVPVLEVSNGVCLFPDLCIPVPQSSPQFFSVSLVPLQALPERSSLASCCLSMAQNAYVHHEGIWKTGIAQYDGWKTGIAYVMALLILPVHLGKSLLPHT